MDIKVRKEYISALNVFATFAVVLWHINDGVYYVHKGLSWFITVAIDSMVAFSVPCFFMITGANLIGFSDRGIVLKDYAARRIKKTVIPFLFWSIVFLIYYAHAELSEITQNQGLGKMILYSIDSIINFKYYTAFWFFIDLFLIYAIIPLIGLIPENNRKKILTIIVLSAIVITYAIPALLKIFGTNIAYIFQGKRFFIFAFTGYMLDRYPIKRKQRTCIYIFAFIAILVHFAGTIVRSLPAGELSSDFRIKDGFISLTMTVGIFAFFKYEYREKIAEKLKKPVDFFCRYSFGIYILHIFVLNEILPRIGIDVYSSATNHIIAYPVAFVLIIAMCIGISWIFRKIPVLKNVLPE